MAQFGFRKENGDWFLGIHPMTWQLYVTKNPFNENIIKLNLVQAQTQYYEDFPAKKVVREFFKNFQIADMKQLAEDQKNFVHPKIELSVEGKLLVPDEAVPEAVPNVS